MNDESEKNPGPQPAAEPQVKPDAHAEVMEQIRRALILDAGLGPKTHAGGGGFDPYNNRGGRTSDRWRVRRRD